jgi:hypothetical protein
VFSDFVNFVMLIAACLGSLALGILAAYGVLKAGFALMRPNKQQPVDTATPVAQV